MHLIQILLPLQDNDDEDFPRSLFAQVRSELTEAFGGVTAFSRAPATGVWEANGVVVRDDILVYEVMADDIDADWWRAYRATLEVRFAQDEIVIRALGMERI